VEHAHNVEDFALLVDARCADRHPLEAGFRDEAHDCFDLSLFHVLDLHERVSERIENDFAQALILLAVSEQNAHCADDLVQN
jgi:hypothetical protein